MVHEAKCNFMVAVIRRVCVMRNRKTTDAQFNLLFKKLHEMTDTQFDETFDHYMTQPEFALCMRKELFNALIDGDI